MRLLATLILIGFLMSPLLAQEVITYEQDGVEYQDMVIRDTLHNVEGAIQIKSPTYKYASEGKNLYYAKDPIFAEGYLVLGKNEPYLVSIDGRRISEPKISGVYFIKIDSITLKKYYNEEFPFTTELYMPK